MKFGLILPNFGSQATRSSIIDSALAAEENGFDSVWLTDHIALPQKDADDYGNLYEALTTMAYLSASTSSIKVGTSTLVLPQRNPLEVAKAVATLDNLSEGRTMITVGIGWSESEYQNLGYQFHNRGKRMNEAIQVLRTCWRSKSEVSFHGKFYQFENVVFSPSPVQAGGPSLWVAGVSQTALKRAIDLADGWHPNGRSPKILEESLSSVKSIIELRPFTVAVRLRVAIDSQQTEVDPTLISGNQEQIIHQLKEYQNAGMTYGIIYFKVQSQSERERVIKIFMQEIAPAFA